VALAESDSLWLHALRDVVDETHPYGEHSCAARVQHVLEWILGRGLLTFGSAIFGLFVLFTLEVQLQRESVLFIGTQFSILYTFVYSPA
jgi:hypothetical protein